MNINQWIADRLEQPTRVALPIMTHPGIELSGKKVIDAVRNGCIQAEAIRLLSERYPSVAATAMMDLTVEAEAFGCCIDFQENEMPHIHGRLLSDAEAIRTLPVPDLTAGRLQEYLLANSLAVEKIHGKPVFGGMIGPFSLAGRLYNLGELMMACYLDPDSVILLLNKCTDFLMSYAQEMKQIGCGGVIMAEPAAGLLSNDDCLVFSSSFVARIVKAVQDETFLVILHNCGNTGHCTDAMLKTGANAFHFGNAVNMVDTLAACPSNVLVMGNIDPVGVMQQGTPDYVKAVTLDLLNATSGYRNYILSTGCDIPPHVPEANIRAFYEALDCFNGLR